MSNPETKKREDIYITSQEAMLKIFSAHLRFTTVDLPQLKERLRNKDIEWVDSEEKITERWLGWLLATFSKNHQLFYSIPHRCVFIKNSIEAIKFTTVDGVCDHMEKILHDESFGRMMVNKLSSLRVEAPPGAVPTCVKSNGSCLVAMEFDNGHDFMWTTEQWTALAPFTKKKI